MPADSPITVVGAGSWGTALAISLARNESAVTLWARDSKHIAEMRRDSLNQRYLPDATFPQTLTVSDDLGHALSHCKAVLVAVPSHAFRETLQQISPYLHPATPLLWATKGFAPQPSGIPQLLSDCINDELGSDGHRAIVSGPSFSKEVAAGLPTAMVASGNSVEACSYAATLFHQDSMRVYTNQDLIGVQLGGAVKNIIAIAAGISDGLGFGANARAAIITRGLVEIARLGIAMGASQDTFQGLAGMGDLVLTCTDDQSRNRQFGLAVGRSAINNTQSIEQCLTSIAQEVEGFNTCREVFNLAQHHQVEMPIVEQVYHILFAGINARESVRALLSRELNNESL